MGFDPSKYGAEITRLLSLDSNGAQAPTLVCGPCRNEAARVELKKHEAAKLFPGRKEPKAPMAGLWLYFSCFEEAHQLVNDLHSPECMFWHAILHRQEPDSGNSAYWFRQLGEHAIFPALALETREILKRNPDAEFRIGDWDPYAFINFCERARDQPGSTQAQTAMEIQLVEWQLLFDYSVKNA